MYLTLCNYYSSKQVYMINYMILLAMKIYKKGYVRTHRFVREIIHTLVSPPVTTVAIIFTAIVSVIYLA